MKPKACENCASDDAQYEPEPNAVLCYHCLAELTELMAGEPEPPEDSEAWSLRC